MSWDLLELRFREKDSPDNLVFEVQEEEWVEEEKEVAVLSEAEVPEEEEEGRPSSSSSSPSSSTSSSPSSSSSSLSSSSTSKSLSRNAFNRQVSFREQKKKTRRRRRRLSIELEVMLEKQGSRKKKRSSLNGLMDSGERCVACERSPKFHVHDSVCNRIYRHDGETVIYFPNVITSTRHKF
jgi:hypothetical protein